MVLKLMYLPQEQGIKVNLLRKEQYTNQHYNNSKPHRNKHCRDKVTLMTLKRPFLIGKRMKKEKENYQERQIVTKRKK